MNGDTVILALCASLLGGDRCGAGLMNRRIAGRRHTPGCPFGQYLRPDDRLTGGSPCSARCRQATWALEAAASWLRAHEVQTGLEARAVGEAAG